MGQHGLSQKKELQDAFQQFNQVSEQLTSSYRDLEGCVDQLTEELVTIENRRLVQLNEKEVLANRLERLLETLPAGVIVLDGNGIVQQCNTVAIELLGMPLLNALWRDVIERAFIPRSNSEEVELRNGHMVSLATCPSGSEPGQILLLMDVTETRALQNMLHRYKRLSSMGEMVASLAHQIRTPLASTLLYASHLRRSDIKPEHQKRYADKIIDRLKYLERMIDDMLVFARGGRSGNDDIDVSSLLSDVGQNMVSLLAGCDCSFEIVNEAQGLVFHGNRDAISGVLQNLVANAIQACLENKEAHKDNQKNDVKLLARRSEMNNSADTIEFLVTDTGSGISSNDQQKIFEPFFTTKSQGTGLGLAVVQAITHAHDGAVWVDSKPGCGATFGLRFPVVKENCEITIL